MAVGRNPVSDLEALVAMPGLEELAGVYEDYGSHGLPRGADPLALVIFDAARGIVGSANKADSLFKFTDVWERLRASAARAPGGGRGLPERPPTPTDADRLRRQAGSGMAQAYAQALCRPAVEVGRAVGLGRPDVTPRWNAPARAHVLHADGTTWLPMSEVWCDRETGEVKGSRSTGVRGPRIAQRFEGKRGGDAGSGVPIAMVGAHGGSQYQRVIYAVGFYRDSDEIGASTTLVTDIIVASGYGFWAVVYDRLMNGKAMREIMRAGAVPVAEMLQAHPARPHVVLPAELQQFRAVTPKKGREGRRSRTPKVVPVKTRVQTFDLGVIDADCGCSAQLWALDGSLVVTAPGVPVSLDAVVAPQLTIDRVGVPGEFAFWGTHLVPCRHGGFRHRVDYSGHRRGRSNDGRVPALADVLRPLPETSSEFQRLRGYRQDAESAISWFKRALALDGRATSMNPEWFLLDMVGLALWCNAVAWDVHASQHTACGEWLARRERRRQAGE